MEHFPTHGNPITGRGGNHLFYNKTNRQISNKAGVLDGIDIRGEGGYIVAPPSIHSNGKQYEWEQSPQEYMLIEASGISL